MQEKPRLLDNLFQSAPTTRTIVLIALFSVALKTLTAWRFPFTGDEAYFVLHGRYVAWGYYDHPPMLGWLIHLLLYLGRSHVLLRLMPIIFSTAVALGMYGVLRPYDQRKAFLAYILFIFSPLNSAFFVLTTDAPLFLFSFLSAFFLFKAEKKCSYLYYLLAGLFLGMAFSSKYFALLLAFSYLAYLLVVKKNPTRLKGFLLLALAAVPFMVQNLLWNYRMGWPNIMHNLVNRVRPDTKPLLNLAILAVILVYLITPPVLWFLFKNRSRILANFRRGPFRIFAVAAVVPLCVFLAVSFKKTVRPHWYVSFLPFAYIMVVLILNEKQLIKSIRFALSFSLVQACLLIGVSFLPLDRLQGVLKQGHLVDLVTYIRPRQILDQLRPYEGRFLFAATSYSTSALLAHYTDDKVIVFGKGSSHARHDDILTDFKQLDGCDILILHKAAKHNPEFQRCFDKMEVKNLTIDGAHFSLLLGRGFKYEQYRQRFLRTICNRYYRIPDWLPGTRSFFHEKYDFPRQTKRTHPAPKIPRT
ncbi:MAG TPA: glycosyltransferase family 39 protein [Sedimentisphaerales bacterium]|nr:glycosyltransferase family 39 protein [Sedimentisphaerales bacterium]